MLPSSSYCFAIQPSMNPRSRIFTSSCVAPSITASGLRRATDQYVLEELARPPSGPSIDVTRDPILELEAGIFEDARVQRLRVVHDDQHRRVRLQLPPRVLEYGAHRSDVVLHRGSRPPRRGGADLLVAPIGEAEQLVRIPVLLVVVDQSGIRRRCDHAVRSSRQLDGTRVRMQHRHGAWRADLGELADAPDRVGRIARQELHGLFDWTAGPLVLEA